MATPATGWLCTHSAWVVSHDDVSDTIRVQCYWTNNGWTYDIGHVYAWVTCNGVERQVLAAGTVDSRATSQVFLGQSDFVVPKTTSGKQVSCSARITSNSSYVSGTKVSQASSVYTGPISSYVVSYDANGGSGAPGNQTKWHGTDLTLSTTKPTRTGYTFTGWATSETGNVAYQPGATYKTNAGLTLYAKWTPITYTISYNANGGTGAPANQTKTYGVNLTLSSTKPTRQDYNFLGWSTSENGGVVYSPGATYTANNATTLYAVWEIAYIKPRINNFSVQRCDSEGVINIGGTYVKVEFDWTTDNDVTEIKIEWKLPTADTWSNTSVTTSGKSGSVSQVVGSGQIDTESSYLFRAYVSDRETDGTTYSPQIVIGSKKYPIDIFRKGGGIAFGKVAELKDIADFDFTVKLGGGLTPIFLEAETNLDDVRTPNFYTGENISTNNYTNCPLSSGTFYLEVVSMGADGQVRQRIASCEKDNTVGFERIYYEGTWGDWHNTNSGVANVSTVGDNLNDYTTTGTYLFGTSSSPLNGPTNVNNGWLVVMALSPTIVKQIWYRIGANNVNDYQTYVRTCNTGSWSNWKRYSNEPVVLYDNNPGSNGTITLSESAANFSYMEIFVHCASDVLNSVKVPDPDGRSFSIVSKTAETSLLQLHTCIWNVSGTTISIHKGHTGNIDQDISDSWEATNLRITKVLGYR